MGKTLPLRRRGTSAEKARILAARAQSQLCNRDFAAQHGIAVSTFYRWQQQLSPSQRADRVHLIEVPNLLGSAPAPRTYRVQLANGAVLAAGALLVPVANAQKKELLAWGYVQADKTIMATQTGERNGRNHRAFMWEYSRPSRVKVFDF